jgi:hypothetical protein
MNMIWMLPYCNKLDVVFIWILILDLMVTAEPFILYLISVCMCYVGHAVTHLLETLRFKAEGRGFDSPW